MAKLPTASELIDPSVSELQFKNGLKRFLENVDSKSVIPNQISSSSNLYDLSKIKVGMYVSVASNSVGYDTGTDAAVIRINPNIDYRFYASHYPSFAFGLWLSNSNNPSGPLERIQYTTDSDGYLSFKISGSIEDDYYLVLNARVGSQNYNEKDNIILRESSNFNFNLTGFFQKNVRDYLLVNNFDKALGIERTATNLVDNAIKLPSHFINAADKIISLESTTYSIAVPLKSGDYYLYAPGRNSDHICGFSDNINLGVVVSELTLLPTEIEEVLRFNINSDGYVMVNTLILGADILPNLRISESINIKNPVITKIGNIPIQSSNGFEESTVIGQVVSMIGLDLLYLNDIR